MSKLILSDETIQTLKNYRNDQINSQINILTPNPSIPRVYNQYSRPARCVKPLFKKRKGNKTKNNELEPMEWLLLRSIDVWCVGKIGGDSIFIEFFTRSITTLSLWETFRFSCDVSACKTCGGKISTLQCLTEKNSSDFTSYFSSLNVS